MAKDKATLTVEERKVRLAARIEAAKALQAKLEKALASDGIVEKSAPTPEIQKVRAEVTLAKRMVAFNAKRSRTFEASIPVTRAKIEERRVEVAADLVTALAKLAKVDPAGEAWLAEVAEKAAKLRAAGKDSDEGDTDNPDAESEVDTDAE